MICKYFPPFSRLPFHFLDGFVFYAEVFGLIQAHLFIFALIVFAFNV